MIYRPTWAEIDLNAVQYNIEQIRNKLPQQSDIIAVVKADAYGHGSVEVARKALESGVKVLAVALLEEGIKLREGGIKAPILVLGWVSPSFVSIAVEYDITLTFFQQDWLEEVMQIPLDNTLKLHMKWDTGMGRVGIRSHQELRNILQLLKKNKNIELEGVYTHFATADEEDLQYFYHQQKRFNKLLNMFNELWSKPVSIHIGNSAASIRFPKQMHNYIRFGISMYGLYPSKTVKSEQRIKLKPVFSLHSRLIHVKRIPKDEGVSYGKTYITQGDEWIGTIPIGYGDGWNRKLQGSFVLVDGKRMPVVGRVCMDQMMIRLDQEYKVGTKVTLIGEQQNNQIEIDEIADYLDTINYEVPCMINSRVPRVYIS
ncbi:alanine racemase [Ornithinibacillus sp. L9]|uniref:Alanine racemase n=2 Tax=Ornithinibacillus caprae TaxID=2678566 RepID=A0A6N8FNQ4_9BACI|nr:alanine racemase [Ornithinibacillus caprae]MUK89717.1 alanine racemase [Ornithinibacillus caprae]